MNVKKHTRRTSAAVAVGLVALAGLGVSASSVAASSSSRAAADLTNAKRLLGLYEQTPAQLAPTALLKKKPPTGKTIVFLQNPNQAPTTIQMGDELTQAAKLLGWKLKRLNVTGALADEQNAIKQALQLKPDGIISFDGFSTTDLRDELQAAKDQKVPFVLGATQLTNGLQFPIVGGYGGNFSNQRQVEAWASWIAVDSGGKGHVALVTIEAIPIVKTFDRMMENALKRLCPGCTFKVVDNSISDIGTTIPGRVVSTLQKDKSVNYLATITGAFLTGVQPALRAAGLDKRVKINGFNPSQSDMDQVKAGTEAAWVGLYNPWGMWWLMDSLARYYSGTALVTEKQAHPPVHVLDKASYKEKDASGKPLTVAVGASHDTLVAQFKKTWLLTT
jgi:hypothetical protein